MIWGGGGGHRLEKRSTNTIQSVELLHLIFIDLGFLKYAIILLSVHKYHIYTM